VQYDDDQLSSGNDANAVKMTTNGFAKSKSKSEDDDDANDDSYKSPLVCFSIGTVWVCLWEHTLCLVSALLLLFCCVAVAERQQQMRSFPSQVKYTMI